MSQGPSTASPLVSVIIPIYNPGSYLYETLESVFAQTYLNCEVIVVDDGSTDNSANVVANYGSAIKYIWQENGGEGKACNTGIKAASGDYIALLDHDDIWLPRKLEVQVQVASHHSKSGIIVCDGVAFSKNQIISNHTLAEDIITELTQSSNGQITKYNFYKRILRGIPIWCPAQTLIPRYVLNTLGLLSERRNDPAEYEYYLRIAERYPFTFHSHSLIRYRYHASSKSGPSKFRSIEYCKMDIALFKRYQYVCPSQYRSDVKAALWDRIERVIMESIGIARSGNLAHTYSFFCKLLFIAITNPLVMIYFAKTWLPWVLRKGLKRILKRMAIIK